MLVDFSRFDVSYFWYLPTDILVPLDNYISRGTDHFLACKDPDYQQSLWTALQSVSFAWSDPLTFDILAILVPLPFAEKHQCL